MLGKYRKGEIVRNGHEQEIANAPGAIANLRPKWNTVGST